MNMQRELTDQLNSPLRDDRIAAARMLGESIRRGELSRRATGEVNNHIHTTYSFSPYEPAAAVFTAWKAGLEVVGVVDHDSIAAAGEIREVGMLVGLPTTVGFELRTSFASTPFAERKINSPDSPGIAYICIHGVPACAYEQVGEFLRPISAARGRRNRQETDALNELIRSAGLGEIDYDKDVLPLSKAAESGSVTERHILSALAGKIEEYVPRGPGLAAFLERRLGLSPTGQAAERLADPLNPHYHYDLIGVLKAGYLSRFFIQPTVEETPPVEEVVAFGNAVAAVPAYAYLGDITSSPTGDKRAEQFEDAYLESLFSLLREIGFPAVTYMPPRNTRRQLRRVQELSARYELCEISGVDINSPRQSLSCPELLDPDYAHLIDSAWALTLHERLVDIDEDLGIFSRKNPLSSYPLRERLSRYAHLGRKMDPRNPDDSIKQVYKELKP